MKNSSIKNAFKNAKNENRPALLTYTQPQATITNLIH